jgi:hypothetical protein
MPPNILQLQRELESLPDDRLIMEAQNPSMYPAYLTATEMQRRQQQRQAFAAHMQQQPTSTVSERLIANATSGIGSIPQPVDPAMLAATGSEFMGPEEMMQQQMMAQSPMPQPMADGGLVGYHEGGNIPPHPHDSRGRHYGGESRLVGERPEWVLPGSLMDRLFGWEDEINVWGRDLSNKTLDFFDSLRSKGYPVYGSGSWGVPEIMKDLPTRGMPQRYSYDPAISGSEAYYGPNHSLPNTTPEMLQRPKQLEQPHQEDRGIASILASMQAPVFGRQAMDMSEYFQMTPEEQKLLDFYGSEADRLESMIDVEADRSRAKANILSNVAAAMARGQVPIAGEPLRQLQAGQEERRQGIVSDAQQMRMAAMAEEAGLSRSQQEALMEQAKVQEQRDYQQSLEEQRRQRVMQYYNMAQSDDPNVQAAGNFMLQTEGISVNRGEMTENKLSDINSQVVRIAQELPDFIDPSDLPLEEALQWGTQMLNTLYAGDTPSYAQDLLMSAIANKYKNGQ